MKPRRLPKAEQKTLTLSVTALGQQGEGLALHEGSRIYVPDILPGETVVARLTDQIDRAVFRAAVVTLESPSADRVEAPCPYYAACGGCTLQHMDGGAYQAWKAGNLREALRRAGVEPLQWDDPVFIPEATRRRASFAVLKQGSRLLAGFHGRRSSQIVDIDACLLLRPSLIKTLEDAKPWLLKILKEGKAASLLVQEVDNQVEAVVTGLLATDSFDLQLREAFSGWAAATGVSRLAWKRDDRAEPEVMIQAQRLIARFGRLRVALPAGAFLQPSREGEAALTQTLLSYLQEARHKNGTPIAELFAGCGTFTGPLLEHGPVHAVEMEDGPANALIAARAGLHLTVEPRNLFNRPLQAAELKKFASVVLDPPRAGAQAQAAELALSSVPTVVYVSCNPTTFAKDATVLRNGGFKVQRLRVVDQFLWSAHTELVGLFTR